MSRMAGGSMPKPSEQAKAAFTKLVPDEPAVTMRPLFGEDLFVRLPDDRSAPIRKVGGRDFEPVPGHAMKGYVTVPATWRAKPAATAAWITASLTFARGLPPKAAGKKAAAKKPSGA